MLNIGLIGTGGIARMHVEAFQKIRSVRIVAACDVDAGRVEAFCKKYNIPHAYTDTQTFLKHPGMVAISNITPDPFHAPISLQAIQQGLHVLCEKPLAENATDARKMTRAAQRKGVINMVQFTYRNSGALEQAARLIARGRLGRITHFESRYYQSWLSAKYWGDWKNNEGWLWRLSTKHGSNGVLGDLGVHIVDFTTYPIGSPVKTVNCQLKTFTDIKGKKRKGYTLDANDTAILRCELANGAIGTIQTTRWATGYMNSLHLEIFGEKGGIRIDYDKDPHAYEICAGKDRHKAIWKTVKCQPALTNFKRFIKSIRSKTNLQPDFARGTEIQQTLDASFRSHQTGKTVKI
ncbi:MAG: Gfo/Idh/MocA family oxidoreductase [Verrucomicrobiota bacterium]